MRRPLRIGFVALATALAAALAYRFAFSNRTSNAIAQATAPAEGNATPAEENVTAEVTVAPIHRGTITEKTTAYGSVVARPDGLHVVSAAFEARVTRVHVTSGEVVTESTPLVDVEPSPTATLELQEAKNAVAAAQRDLELVQQRYEQKLATSQELSTAQATLRSSQARLSSLEKAGAGEKLTLKAGARGVVTKISAQPGQIAPAGSPLIETSHSDALEAKLGVLPENVGRMHVEQSVSLRPVQAQQADPTVGHIRQIANSVNPETRLIDISVSFTTSADLILERAVIGELDSPSPEGLIVPRAAVVRTEDGDEIFTVENGHAVRHHVTIKAESDHDALVESQELHEGDNAIVVGSAVARDGMAVTIEIAPTPASAPSTAGSKP